MSINLFGGTSRRQCLADAGISPRRGGNQVVCMLHRYRSWMTNGTCKGKAPDLFCAQIVPTRNQSGSQPFVTNLTYNPKVTGSNPVPATKNHRGIAEMRFPFFLTGNIFSSIPRIIPRREGVALRRGCLTFNDY